MIATVTLNVAIDKRYVVNEFCYGTVMRVNECSYSAGGKGLNVSRVAQIAGEQVLALGFVGGYAGSYVTSELERCGIETDFTKVSGESRSCINLYDQATGRQTELLEPGVTVPEEAQLRFLENYSKRISQCSIVAISGSVPKGIGADFYPKLIEIAKSMGKKVLLDTGGALLLSGVKAVPYFIKPNSDEVAVLTGEDVSDQNRLISCAEKLYSSGIENVVISLGKDGALLVCAEGVFKGSTPDIPVVNTVGCGDSMVAAFAVGFARGLSSEQTLKSALAISTANALRPETGFFLPKDYERLIDLVSVVRI